MDPNYFENLTSSNILDIFDNYFRKYKYLSGKTRKQVLIDYINSRDAIDKLNEYSSDFSEGLANFIEKHYFEQLREFVGCNKDSKIGRYCCPAYDIKLESKIARPRKKYKKINMLQIGDFACAERERMEARQRNYLTQQERMLESLTTPIDPDATNVSYKDSLDNIYCDSVRSIWY